MCMLCVCVHVCVCCVYVCVYVCVHVCHFGFLLDVCTNTLTSTTEGSKVRGAAFKMMSPGCTKNLFRSSKTLGTMQQCGTRIALGSPVVPEVWRM